MAPLLPYIHIAQSYVYKERSGYSPEDETILSTEGEYVLFCFKYLSRVNKCYKELIANDNVTLRLYIIDVTMWIQPVCCCYSHHDSMCGTYI